MGVTRTSVRTKCCLGAPSCIRARIHARDQDVKAKDPRILKGSRGLGL